MRKSKLGLVLAIMAFTFGSLALLLDVSCSRSGPVQQRQVAEESTADYPVPEYEKMAQRPDMEGVYDMRDVDEQPEIIKEVRLAYPPLPQMLGKTSTVVMAAVVDEKGGITNIIVLSSTGGDFRKAFEEEAVKAFSRYQFKPALKNGQAVPCWAKITVRFKLSQKDNR